MKDKEYSELKRTLTLKRNTVPAVYGCYISAEGEIISRFRRSLGLADALRPIAERHDTTVGSVAVAWTLAWRGVTAAARWAWRPGRRRCSSGRR